MLQLNNKISVCYDNKLIVGKIISDNPANGIIELKQLMEKRQIPYDTIAYYIQNTRVTHIYALETMDEFTILQLIKYVT